MMVSTTTIIDAESMSLCINDYQID